MRTNKFLTAAVTAAALLSSCVKTTEPASGDGTDRTVRITIKQQGTMTRGIGAPVEGNTAVSFTDGLLLFTDGGGKITKRVDVNATGDDIHYELGRFYNVVGKDKLATGAVITGVPIVSTKVHFIGNPAAAVEMAADEGGNFSALKTGFIDQYDATDQGVGKVTLYGEGTLSPDDLTGQNVNYSASFDVLPIVTRLEIGSILWDASEASEPMTYKVTGVFINRFYTEMRVDGTIDGWLAEHGTDPDNYLPQNVNPTGKYVTYGGMFSYIPNGMATETDGSANGNAAHVWAYNLLAPTGGQTPSIVIRLDDVTVDGVALTGSQFVTYSTFKKSDGTPLSTLPQGRVWKINRLSFTEYDLFPAPYVKSKSVTVTATLLPWGTDEVTVEY